MIIKTVALGNNEESYIEKRISDGVNIILSDDNNKGKTILIQSMLYAMVLCQDLVQVKMRFSSS